MMGVMEVAFDVEAAIAEFVADPSLTSLALPHMTTGQRKSAKKIAELHAELTCESFGFGQERQLHLSKKGSESRSCADSSPVQLKNTVFGDFIGGEMVLKQALNSEEEQRSAPASAECSTNASESVASCSTSESQSIGSPASSSRELPVSPCLTFATRDWPVQAASSSAGGVEVRNTFIHFSGVSTDERLVQSMPHGMFGHCLSEESKKACASTPRPSVATTADVALPAVSWTEPRSSAESTDGSVLAQGTEVVIQGLTKLPAYNGLNAVVQSFDEETGRYSILLSTPACDGKQKTAKVKGENLWVVTAPRHTPSLMLDDFDFQDAGQLPSLPTTPMWDDVPTSNAFGLRAFW